MKKFITKIAISYVRTLFFSVFMMFAMSNPIFGVTDEIVASLGKSYVTNPAPYISFPDTGNQELTNGIFGIAVDKFNGNCSGYNADVTTVIDLENEGFWLSKFQIRYMVLITDNDENYIGIGPISSATISISNDNINWTILGSVDVPPVVDKTFQIAVLDLENIVNGRYVKFEIEKTNIYVSIDELSVYSRPVAVSLGKSYVTNPAPYISFPDTGNQELTNGIFGIAVDKFNGNCSGYNADVTTVIDLESEGFWLSRFQIRYMVLITDNDENYIGIGPISSATISISNDSINWTILGSVDVPPVEDKTFQIAVLELENIVNGRYVKFEIEKTNIYVLIDELSVFTQGIIISNNMDLLPDGSEFDFWDCEMTSFENTYHVNNQDVNASDENEGTENSPFKTINKAASIAQAGDKILIHEGVYHETIRDVNGGTDKWNMVLFEGEGNVVITGAVEWDVDFVPSEGLRETAPTGEADLFSPIEESYYANNNANVYMGKIPANALADGYNPFSVLNMSPFHFGVTKDSIPIVLQRDSLDVFNFDPQLKKRGLLFCYRNSDGERMEMEQVVRPHELWQKSGTYWVDESGRVIHFRLKDDADPVDYTLELAVKEQGFAPDKSGLSYIYIKNLIFEKFSNPFPAPQKGAVSTNCGHHFIIDGCTVKDINSIGLDMGFLSHHNLHDGDRGYHIVRNSNFINCGISAISALPTKGEYLTGMLVENNTFSGNCWHDAEPIWECAAIKNHYTADSLYRNNIIKDTYYGAGIWLDKAIKNTRVCNNIIVGVHHSLFGGILIEATYYKNLVDHNFICNTGYRYIPIPPDLPNDELDDYEQQKTGGHGIYLNEVDNLIIYGNMIFNIVGDGIFACDVTNPRLIGTYDRKPTTGSGNVVMRNIIGGYDIGNIELNYRSTITLLTKFNYINEDVLDENLWYTFRIRKPDNEMLTFELGRAMFGFEENGTLAGISVDLDLSELDADITVNGNTQTLHLNQENEIYNYMQNLLESLD